MLIPQRYNAIISIAQSFSKVQKSLYINWLKHLKLVPITLTI